MPVFTIETPSGRKLDIEAGSEAAAIKGAQQWEASNPVKAEASTVGEVATDVAKQVPSGLVQGAANLPTLLPRLADAAGGLVNTPAEEKERQNIKDMIRRDAGPGLSEWVASLLPKPETGVGGFVRPTMEAVPAALGSVVGLGRGLASGIGAGVASEAAGRATEGTAAEPWARVGAGIVGGAAGLGAGAGVSAVQRGAAAVKPYATAELASMALGLPPGTGAVARYALNQFKKGSGGAAAEVSDDAARIAAVRAERNAPMTGEAIREATGPDRSPGSPIFMAQLEARMKNQTAAPSEVETLLAKLAKRGDTSEPGPGSFSPGRFLEAPEEAAVPNPAGGGTAPQVQAPFPWQTPNVAETDASVLAGITPQAKALAKALAQVQRIRARSGGEEAPVAVPPSLPAPTQTAGVAPAAEVTPPVVAKAKALASIKKTDGKITSDLPNAGTTPAAAKPTAPVDDDIPDFLLRKAQAFDDLKPQGAPVSLEETFGGIKPLKYEPTKSDYAHLDIPDAVKQIVAAQKAKGAKFFQGEEAYTAAVTRRLMSKDTLASALSDATGISIKQAREYVQGAKTRSEAKQLRDHLKELHPKAAEAIDKTFSKQGLADGWRR